VCARSGPAGKLLQWSETPFTLFPLRRHSTGAGCPGRTAPTGGSSPGRVFPACVPAALQPGDALGSPVGAPFTPDVFPIPTRPGWPADQRREIDSHAHPAAPQCCFRRPLPSLLRQPLACRTPAAEPGCPGLKAVRSRCLPKWQCPHTLIIPPIPDHREPGLRSILDQNLPQKDTSLRQTAAFCRIVPTGRRLGRAPPCPGILLASRGSCASPPRGQGRARFVLSAELPASPERLSGLPFRVRFPSR